MIANIIRSLKESKMQCKNNSHKEDKNILWIGETVQQAKKSSLGKPGHLSSVCESGHLSLIPGNYGARWETLFFNPHTHPPAFAPIHHTYTVTNKHFASS